MQLFYTTHIENSVAFLRDEEANHCGRVLRKSVGDTITITDGNGLVYSGVIENIAKKEVLVTELEIQEKQTQISPISIAIAPTKNISRFEWFLEKATEIGIRNIYPILTTRSERKVIKPERLEKILVSAMKQSYNLHKPALHKLTKINDILTNNFGDHKKYMAHCMDPKEHFANVYNGVTPCIVLIGPEGDFSPEELALAKANDWKEISLGTSRLRTETAGIVATHIASICTLNK